MSVDDLDPNHGGSSSSLLEGCCIWWLWRLLKGRFERYCWSLSVDHPRMSEQMIFIVLWARRHWWWYLLSWMIVDDSQLERASGSCCCCCVVGIGLGFVGQSIMSRRRSRAVTAGCGEGDHVGGLLWLMKLSIMSDMPEHSIECCRPAGLEIPSIRHFLQSWWGWPGIPPILYRKRRRAAL